MCYLNPILTKAGGLRQVYSKTCINFCVFGKLSPIKVIFSTQDAYCVGLSEKERCVQTIFLTARLWLPVQALISMELWRFASIKDIFKDLGSAAESLIAASFFSLIGPIVTTTIR